MYDIYFDEKELREIQTSQNQEVFEQLQRERQSAVLSKEMNAISLQEMI
jgi:hypothetical protein